MNSPGAGRTLWFSYNHIVTRIHEGGNLETGLCLGFPHFCVSHDVSIQTKGLSVKPIFVLFNP